jgi:hypothetical protein
METCVEEKRVGFEVSSGLIIREKDPRDCIDRLKHSGSDESALVVTEREHGECTNNVPCRTVCVDGPRDARLVISLSWEADSAWTLRMLTVLLRCARLRMLMAWCSTLGGAHSQLGDTRPDHAVLAGELSLKQLALATDMDDPLLASKCKIFSAYSLLQRGKLKAASKIIKQQYHYATEEAVTLDEKLVCMCQAAWARLKTLQHSSTPASVVVKVTR